MCVFDALVRGLRRARWLELIVRFLPVLASATTLQPAMPFKIPTPLSSQASVEKRSAEGASSQQAKKAKLPPLSDLVAMESAPKRPNAQRLPAVAPLNVCIYKVRPPL